MSVELLKSYGHSLGSLTARAQEKWFAGKILPGLLGGHNFWLAVALVTFLQYLYFSLSLTYKCSLSLSLSLAYVAYAHIKVTHCFLLPSHVRTTFSPPLSSKLA